MYETIVLDVDWVEFCRECYPFSVETPHGPIVLGEWTGGHGMYFSVQAFDCPNSPWQRLRTHSMSR